MPSAVTLTFVDANNVPVPNVRLAVVGQGSWQADTNGVASFGLDDGTYTVAAANVGLVMFPNTTLVVNGTTAETITGNAANIPAPSANQFTAYLYTRDATGAIEPGVKVSFQMIDARSSGGAYDNTPLLVTSDGNGLVSTPLQCDATYRIWRGDSKQNAVTMRMSTRSGQTFALPNLIGH
jgi:hypothetical protein